MIRLRLILFPIAIVIECACVLANGRECGFGNWVLNRRLGEQGRAL